MKNGYILGGVVFWENFRLYYKTHGFRDLCRRLRWCLYKPELTKQYINHLKTKRSTRKARKVWIPLDELTPSHDIIRDESYYRLKSDLQGLVERDRIWIKDFWNNSPISFCAETNKLLNGHHRVHALKSLGFKGRVQAVKWEENS